MSANKRIEKVLSNNAQVAEVNEYELFEYVTETLEIGDDKKEMLAALRLKMSALSSQGRKIYNKSELETKINEIKRTLDQELNESRSSSEEVKDEDTEDDKGTVESPTLRCEKCGNIYKEDYEYCPECGEKLIGDLDSRDTPTLSYREIPSGEVISKKSGGSKISKKAMAIIGGVIVAAIVLVVIFVNIMSPKPLILNSGNSIDIYVGEKESVNITGEGLEEKDYQMTLWTSDNDDVLKVNNGEIEAFYDSTSFNAIEEDTGAEESVDVCSCTTYVRAQIEKGIRKWEGSAKVNISIKPVELKDGKLIKKPADSRDSSLEVSTMDEFDTYIYLKSKTKQSNDMSFTVKRGSTTKVDVPTDVYDLYWASGTTWYGSEFTFGPDTVYQKSKEEWDFREYAWKFTLGAEDGNVESDFVNEDDFPEL